MKYPQDQFETLVKCLTIFAKYADLNAMHPMNLHQLIYNQFADGQSHNRIIVDNGIAKRKFKLIDGELVEQAGSDLFDFTCSFELYPNNTTDSNIEVAVKRAIKQAEALYKVSI